MNPINYIKGNLKPNSKTNPEAIICGMVFLVVLWMLWWGSAQAMDFNPTLDFVAEWKIPRHVLVGTYNDYQYQWTDYAWNTFKDKEFMYMLASENGLFNHDRKSLVSNEPSYGFCQIHQGYHPEIVNDKRFFTDPAWQMGECHRLFEGGVAFYGYKRFNTDMKFRADRIRLFDFN